MPEPEKEPQGTAPTISPRDTIIFLPGIGNAWGDKSLESIARQMANSLKLADPEHDASYEAEMQLAKFNGRSNKVCRISRRSEANADPEPVLDMLEMDYRQSMTKWFAEKAILTKCILTFLAIMTAGAQYVRSRFARNQCATNGKTVGEQVQLAYASAILFLLSCYVVLLFISAVASFQALLVKPQKEQMMPTVETSADAAVATNATAVSEDAIPAPAVPAKTDLTSKKKAEWGLFEFTPILFALTTLLGVAAPDKWKAMIESASADYVCILYYMGYGSRRSAIVGEMNKFIEGFFEWAGDRKPKVHIFAYSFGSVVALDTLFPIGAGSTPRVKRISTLVTIGSPFDMLRMTWPGYFAGRAELSKEHEPLRWINVYSSSDTISSNFRNDDKEAEAQQTVICNPGASPAPPENVPYKEGRHAASLSFFDTVLLAGLRNHATYWTEEDDSERNCFTYIVERMPELGRRSFPSR